MIPSFLRALSVPAEHHLYERMLEVLGVTEVGVDAEKALAWDAICPNGRGADKGIEARKAL